MLGAAAIVLGFSFFCFFFSRLPRCSPFALAQPSGLEWADDHISTAGQNPVRHSGSTVVRTLASNWRIVGRRRHKGRHTEFMVHGHHPPFSNGASRG